MAQIKVKKVSVRGLIKEAMKTAGKAHTLRVIYDAVERKIPAEEGVASYSRVKGHAADDDTPLRDKMAAGRKRLVYRALSDMIYEGEATADEGRDWDKKYTLTEKGAATITAAAPVIAKRVDKPAKAKAKAKAGRSAGEKAKSKKKAGRGRALATA